MNPAPPVTRTRIPSPCSRRCLKRLRFSAAAQATSRPCCKLLQDSPQAVARQTIIWYTGPRLVINPGGGKVQPRVSIIIPTYNRRIILEKALRALFHQTIDPQEYEVILIDDGSADGTYEMVQSLNPPYHLQYRRTERRGPAAARNLGIELARAELIIFIDSDIVVNDRFVAAHLAAHTADNLIGHGPVIHTDNLDNPTSAHFKVTDISRAFFATGNASIKKKHLVEAGLFDESFVEYGWEDLELGIRLRRLGLRAVKVPEDRGYHYKKEAHRGRRAYVVPAGTGARPHRRRLLPEGPYHAGAAHDDALSPHLLAGCAAHVRPLAPSSGHPPLSGTARSKRPSSGPALFRPLDHVPLLCPRDAGDAAGHSSREIS
ncbi:MAG: hypothetical protein CW345_08635 [Firmicutes bacterium]|nr:hypothetical protein [Bacillota bacterium]